MSQPESCARTKAGIVWAARKHYVAHRLYPVWVDRQAVSAKDAADSTHTDLFVT